MAREEGSEASESSPGGESSCSQWRGAGPGCGDTTSGTRQTCEGDAKGLLVPSLLLENLDLAIRAKGVEWANSSGWRGGNMADPRALGTAGSGPASLTMEPSISGGVGAGGNRDLEKKKLGLSLSNTSPR